MNRDLTVPTLRTTAWRRLSLTAMLLFFALICISCGGGGGVPPGTKPEEPKKTDPTGGYRGPVTPPSSFTGKRYALLVGVRKYRLTEPAKDAKDDEPFPNLMYSEKDVVDLADAMKKAGYQESNIVLMTGERGEKDSALKPEPRNVLNKLSQLAGKCTDQDVLVVGFAGHGFQKSDGSRPRTDQAVLLLRGREAGRPRRCAHRHR